MKFISKAVSELIARELIVRELIVRANLFKRKKLSVSENIFAKMALRFLGPMGTFLVCGVYVAHNDNVEQPREDCWQCFAFFKNRSRRKTPQVVFSLVRHGGPGSPLERRYKLGENLGEGSFGVVRGVIKKEGRCSLLIDLREEFFGPEFACKEIDLLKQGREKVENEIEVMGMLDHKNILKLHEVFETSGVTHLVMQLAHGDLLGELGKKEGGWTPKLAAFLMKQVLEATQHMHARFVAHRDMKLENLLVVEVLYTKYSFRDCTHHYQGRLAVADFGFATSFTPTVPMIRRCGTLQYAAPEIFNDTGYSAKVDIWSDGVILFSMLTNRLPFNPKSASGGDNTQELIKEVRKGYTQEAGHNNLIKNKSLEAANLLLSDASGGGRGMLALDPAKRPSAAEALQDAFFTGQK